jgi:hypothetical protein
MRYFVGLVLTLALVAWPSNANAAHTQKEPGEPSHWLRLELATGELRLTSTELQRLALIPQHLEERIPGHRKKQSDDGEAKADFEIDYVAAEREEANQRRGLAIGLGVAIPLIVVGLSLGIATAAVSRSIDIDF